MRWSWGLFPILQSCLPPLSPPSWLGEAKVLLALLLDIPVNRFWGPVGPGWQSSLCLLSFGSPSITLLYSGLFKVMCIGMRNVFHFSVDHPPVLFPLHLPFSVASGLPYFDLPGPPLFTLLPPNPPTLIWVRGSFFELQGVKPSVYVLFSLCPDPIQRFKELEENLLFWKIYMCSNSSLTALGSIFAYFCIPVATADSLSGHHVLPFLSLPLCPWVHTRALSPSFSLALEAVSRSAPAA